jgi:lincosamide nucleotidyltransferase A/C/D/E
MLQTCSMPTGSNDVIWLLSAISELGGFPIVVGGWGVDALVGQQTRVHRDLDLLLDDGKVAAVIERLSGEGFVPTSDWLPVRIELSDLSNDRHVDLHPVFDNGRAGLWQHGLDGVRFDYAAKVITVGEIGGLRVRCLSVAMQIDLHSGYDHREVDRHDLQLRQKLKETQLPID